MDENDRRENIDYYRRIIMEDHGERHIKDDEDRKQANEEYFSKQTLLDEIESDLKPVKEPLEEYANSYEYKRENPIYGEVRDENVMESIEKESPREMDRLNEPNPRLPPAEKTQGNLSNTQEGLMAQTSNTEESKKNSSTNEVADYIVEKIYLLDLALDDPEVELVLGLLLILAIILLILISGCFKTYEFFRCASSYVFCCAAKAFKHIIF